MAALLFVSGSRSGQRIALSAPRIVIGRHPACDIVLDISSVSRQHAAVTVETDDVFIEDLRSRNGTTVNGRRLTARHRLVDGDEVVICDQCLRFQESEHADATILGAGPRTDEAEMVEAEINDSHIVSQVDMQGLSSDAAEGPLSEAHLRAVVGLRRALGGSLSLDEVLPRMLAGLFGIFAQAERGFVLLIDPKLVAAGLLPGYCCRELSLIRRNLLSQPLQERAGGGAAAAEPLPARQRREDQAGDPVCRCRQRQPL